jgi:hypothetical protein
MRLGFAALLGAIVVAAAFALPSTATHEPIQLRVLDSRVELPSVDGSEAARARFEYSPPDFQGRASVLMCKNGLLDRAGLTSKHENDLCSNGPAGLGGTVGDATSAVAEIYQAGRYEAVQRRLTPCDVDCDPQQPPHWNASNVVAFEAVDPCRLTLGEFRFTTRTVPVMRGAPFPCFVTVKGSMGLTGEDGSALTLATSGFLTVEHRTAEFRVPSFYVSADGASAELSARLGSRLASSMAGRARTNAVTVFWVAPASVSLVHRAQATTVRVRQGRVVVINASSQFSLMSAVKSRCGSGRPTVACLSRIRYKFFTRRAILRPRVLRAGKSARFKIPPSSVRFR